VVACNAERTKWELSGCVGVVDPREEGLRWISLLLVEEENALTCLIYVQWLVQGHRNRAFNVICR
jgi:hypothetical protein